jgi:acyl-CoA reductase-like NAD-dependent aldehyde dehydrogenase
MISFTGSTAVGEHIASVAAPMMKKLSLELGGKNAAVVFADANLDQCLEVQKNVTQFFTARILYEQRGRYRIRIAILHFIQ